MLADWAIEFYRNGLALEFRFAGGHAMDTAEDGSRHAKVQIADTVGLSDSMKLKATVRFTGPQSSYRDGPVVDYVRARWLRESSSRRELPPARGYAFLTWLESLAGNRASVTVKFAIEPSVLATGGRLTAQNDPPIGHKLKGPVAPLTPDEVGWLNAFVRETAWRVIEVESAIQPTPLKLADLPPLP